MVGFEESSRSDGMSRRCLLHCGAMSGLAATLPFAGRNVRAESAGTALPQPGKAIKSCILIFHYGGPSHLDTLDPKPEAAAGIRGEYKTIQTAVPSINVTEHLPNLARNMGRIALVRSMHHQMTNHNSAASEGLTGRPPTGGDLELLADEARAFPALGSAVAFGLGQRAHILPYVAVPYTIFNVVQIPGQTAGQLGGAFDRFQVSQNPNATDFRIPALELPGEQAPTHLVEREKLLRQLDLRSDLTSAARMRVMQERAIELITAESVRNGFDIGKEPAALRDRYGRNLLGQSILLARRLVESGVNFVTVFDGQTNGQDANWDSHQTVFPRHRQLIPPADQGVSALIEDLASRGLLDSTLVISMGEFGRTPKINGQAGRDHWPHCYTALLAGGGVQGGSIYGASDPIGAAPSRDPVSPADLAATVLWRFGVNLDLEIHDQTGRPSRLTDGQPLAKLFS